MMNSNEHVNNLIFGSQHKIVQIALDAIRDITSDSLENDSFTDHMETFKTNFDNYASIEAAQAVLDWRDLDGDSLLNVTAQELQILIDIKECHLHGILFVKDSWDKLAPIALPKNPKLAYKNIDVRYQYSLIQEADIDRMMMELQSGRYLLTEDLNFIDDNHIRLVKQALVLGRFGTPHKTFKYQLGEWVQMGLKHLLDYENRLVADAIFDWLEVSHDFDAQMVEILSKEAGWYPVNIDIAFEITTNKSYPATKSLSDRLNGNLEIKKSIPPRKNKI